MYYNNIITDNTYMYIIGNQGNNLRSYIIHNICMYIISNQGNDLRLMASI